MNAEIKGICKAKHPTIRHYPFDTPKGVVNETHLPQLDHIKFIIWGDDLDGDVDVFCPVKGTWDIHFQMNEKSFREQFEITEIYPHSKRI